MTGHMIELAGLVIMLVAGLYLALRGVRTSSINSNENAASVDANDDR